MVHGSKKIRGKQVNKVIDQEQNDEILYGRQVVLTILEEKKPINKVFIQKGLSGDKIQTILELVKQRQLVFQEVPKAKLDDLSQGQNHQGVVVTVPPVAYQSLEDCFALAEAKGQEPFFLILDGIEDPHNLGSIIRSADALGVHGIIIPKRRAASLTGIVAKTSTGALEHIPVVRVTNLGQVVDQLKTKGVWIFATDMAGQDIRSWNSQGPIAVIIGNEGQGVSKKLLDHADQTITIPMVGHVQSLNASVAASIIMYEVASKRIPMP
ncbi:23S rRNA (guanosine(2251)-2'-O)-methyltransferase RlmB [Eremococcus coleocola]|uniref:RNA methyltransferase, TrmH family, group 3 n=1 Tax=Eremococcus coleocola ACS-139-V-Col8 TaxID=908337 RepID=E4KNN9_9LACT|nr:RNA methyltransferase, TrmH family, group 3 [Eremococcus coleocola ACS-139-V-Col8]